MKARRLKSGIVRLLVLMKITLASYAWKQVCRHLVRLCAIAVLTAPPGIVAQEPPTSTPTPVIREIAPPSSNQGSFISICGTHLFGDLSAGPKVVFETNPATIVYPFMFNDTSIEFTVPRGTGNVRAHVETPGGRSNSLPFRYAPPGSVQSSAAQFSVISGIYYQQGNSENFTELKPDGTYRSQAVRGSYVLQGEWVGLKPASNVTNWLRRSGETLISPCTGLQWTRAAASNARPPRTPTATDQLREVTGLSGNADEVASASNGELVSVLVVGIDQSVLVLDANTGSIRGKCPGNYSAYVISPNGETVFAVLGRDIDICKPFSGLPARSFFNNFVSFNSLALSPNGQILAAGDEAGTIYVLDVVKGLIWTSARQTEPATKICVSDKGALLAWFRNGRQLKYWEAGGHTFRQTVLPMTTSALPFLALLSGPRAIISESGGNGADVAWIWDTSVKGTSGLIRIDFGVDALSPDNRLAVSIGKYVGSGPNGYTRLTVRELKTGGKTQEFTIPSDVVASAVISQTGNDLLLSTIGGRILAASVGSSTKNSAAAPSPNIPPTTEPPGTQSNGTVDPISTLRSNIQFARTTAATMPLYNGDWRSVATLTLSNSLNAYNQLYLAAINRRSIALDQLAAADLFLSKGDTAHAKAYWQKAVYLTLDSENLVHAANNAYSQGVSNTAAVLNAVYRLSSQSASAVGYLACGTPCYDSIDAITLFTDYAVDNAIQGKSEANQNLIKNGILKLILDFSGVQKLATTQVTHFVGQPQSVHMIVDQVLGQPQFKTQIMTLLGRTSAYASNAAVSAAADSVWQALSTINHDCGNIQIPAPGVSDAKITASAVSSKMAAPVSTASSAASLRTPVPAATPPPATGVPSQSSNSLNKAAAASILARLVPTMDLKGWLLVPFLEVDRGAYISLENGIAGQASLQPQRNDFLASGAPNPSSETFANAIRQSPLNGCAQFTAFRNGHEIGLFNVRSVTVAYTPALKVAGRGSAEFRPTGDELLVCGTPAHHDFWIRKAPSPGEKQALAKLVLAQWPTSARVNGAPASLQGKPLQVSGLTESTAMFDMTKNGGLQVFVTADALMSSVGGREKLPAHASVLADYDKALNRWQVLLSCSSIGDGNGGFISGNKLCGLVDVLDVNDDGTADVIIEESYGEVANLVVYKFDHHQLRPVTHLFWNGS